MASDSTKSKNILGCVVDYDNTYSPGLLTAIKRSDYRSELEKPVGSISLPMDGVDVWRCYELSWLNHAGLPQSAILEFRVPSSSEFIVESKSLKLYLNSFNFSRYASASDLLQVIRHDLTNLMQTDIDLRFVSLDKFVQFAYSMPQGECLDKCDVSCDIYQPDPLLLQQLPGTTDDTCYHSNLLRSHCPVTNQPDWATVCIRYAGQRIDPESLLRYIVSFRRHQGFHEQCVEKLFTDITLKCKPARLSVYAGFTRRGGIDISPVRESKPGWIKPERLCRQ